MWARTTSRLEQVAAESFRKFFRQFSESPPLWKRGIGASNDLSSASGRPNLTPIVRGKADITAAGYNLSLNRYKEVVHEELQHQSPKDILADLEKLEAEIQQGLKELEGMLR